MGARVAGSVLIAAAIVRSGAHIQQEGGDILSTERLPGTYGARHLAGQDDISVSSGHFGGQDEETSATGLVARFYS